MLPRLVAATTGGTFLPAVVAATGFSFWVVATAACGAGSSTTSFCGRLDEGRTGGGGPVLRGGAAGAPDPLKTLPKTNLALRPFHHPRGALSKNHVFIGSQRLKGRVDATKLRHYLGHPDSHHGLAHWFVVHSSGQRLDENGRCDILQLTAGPNPMQEYARHVLGVNTR